MNFKIGDKVVPLRKTHGSEQGDISVYKLKGSDMSKGFVRQGFMYIHGIRGDEISLNHSKSYGGADYFDISDIVHYTRSKALDMFLNEV